MPALRLSLTHEEITLVTTLDRHIYAFFFLFHSSAYPRRLDFFYAREENGDRYPLDIFIGRHCSREKHGPFNPLIL